MKPLPHHYTATASVNDQGNVLLSSGTLPPITSAPPAEFGGPGDQWAPETLLLASVADCFVLSFRAIAAASRLSWKSLACETAGTLDRVEGSIRFAEVRVRARLIVSEGTDAERARKLLEKAEKGCPIGQSLRLEPVLETEILIE